MSQANNFDRTITICICTFAIAFGVIFKVLPSFYYWQGKSNLEKENYVKARQYLKNAYYFNKSNKNYRYYYVKSLEHLNPSFTIQKEVFEIASGNIKDSAQQVAESKLSEWRNAIFVNIGNNYIEQAPFDKGIVRWDINKFPLKVLIVDNCNGDIPDYYFIEINRAFSEWQAATKFITFTQTDNEKEANIVVKIDNPSKESCEEGSTCKYVVGYTAPVIKGSLLKKMNINLYSKDPYGNYFSDKEMYNTTLHEIGHSLGIMGHSYSTGDLMYMSTNKNAYYTPYRSAFQYISTQDLNTMNLLYRLIPQITNTPLKEFKTKGLIYAPVVLGTSNEISSRKLKEAKNYIKNAPELPGGYIDLGIAYAELGKNSAALNALKKAYDLSKTDNEKYLSCYNLASMYINNGQAKNALKYANEAQSIFDNKEIQELISNIKHAQATKQKPFKEKVRHH